MNSPVRRARLTAPGLAIVHNGRYPLWLVPMSFAHESAGPQRKVPILQAITPSQTGAVGRHANPLVVVDAETGAVYEGPFGQLPNALLYYGDALRYDRDGNGNYLYDDLSYRLNSRLLIARGCPNFKNCGAYFFEWTGSEFKLQRKISAAPEPR